MTPIASEAFERRFSKSDDDLVTVAQAKQAAAIVAASELAHAAELLLGSGSSAVRHAGALISLRIEGLVRQTKVPYCDEMDQLQPFINLADEMSRREAEKP